MTISKRALLASALVATIAAAPAIAQEASRVKVGTLSCDISAGIGLIVASKKQVNCMFTPSAGGLKETYTGSITKFGLDVGATGGGEMVWVVYAPTTNLKGALAGTYTGAFAEATVGAGVGANVLIGGSDRTISLQPISVQGQMGMNLAAGVAGLELRRAS
ncbi:MAG: DUF992 domain-containing protein [Xanthobacteraceae bacterium]